MDPKQLLDRLKTLVSALTMTQRLTIAAAFVAVAGVVIGSGYWLNQTSYRLLFSELDAEAAADVAGRLREQKVDFQIDEGGRAIRVPAGQVDALRLDFAGRGLPSSGRIGFEIFDRTNFGATEFLEQVNYRRALEGEIARTIGSLSEVASARVHITMAKDSLFGSQEQAAKASVVLKLRQNRPLASATAHAVASLVAASVEGLQAEAVVIVDSFGRPLTRPRSPGDEPLDAAQLDRQQRLERDLGMRLIALLEPVVGIGRVRVNVAARLTRQSVEETEEKWDPDTAVVRSRQISSATEAAAGLARVAGTRSNLPTPADADTKPAALLPLAASGPGRTAETTNYEISKTVRHSVTPLGDIARLSVAVVVDDDHGITKDPKGRSVPTTKRREPAQMQKIQGLVADAVGFDRNRGDHVTVENIAFDEPPVEESSPLADVWPKYAPYVLDTGRIAIVLGLGVCAVLFVLRPLVRRTLKRDEPRLPEILAEQLPRPVAEIQQEIEAEMDLEPQDDQRAAGARRAGAITKRLGTMAANDPEDLARLLRTWLVDEGR